MKELFDFALERHSIAVRKQSGKPKPWTLDPILQQYRFCNVHREADKVTQWIKTNWREPHSDDPDLWFAMVVARVINWPPSLEAGGYPVPWKPKRWVVALDARKAAGEKVFTGAYMIRGVEANGATKVQYLAEQVLGPLWARRDAGRAAFGGDNLQQAHEWLLGFYGMGSFLAAQVVADVKHTPLLAGARDWWTWAAPGPGSLRGLNRVLGRAVDDPWNASDWLREIQVLRTGLNAVLRANKIAKVCAQDTQNVCCEFDKYMRVKLGEGAPRNRYPGVA